MGGGVEYTFLQKGHQFRKFRKFSNFERKLEKIWEIWEKSVENLKIIDPYTCYVTFSYIEDY